MRLDFLLLGKPDIVDSVRNLQLEITSSTRKKRSKLATIQLVIKVVEVYHRLVSFLRGFKIQGREL
jgi:hypothetical protein